MDFFSVPLPGATLTYLLRGEVGPVVVRDRYATFARAQARAASWSRAIPSALRPFCWASVSEKSIGIELLGTKMSESLPDHLSSRCCIHGTPGGNQIGRGDL